jgi:hypothetical protein
MVLTIDKSSNTSRLKMQEIVKSRTAFDLLQMDLLSFFFTSEGIVGAGKASMGTKGGRGAMVQSI